MWYHQHGRIGSCQLQSHSQKDQLLTAIIHRQKILLWKSQNWGWDWSTLLDHRDLEKPQKHFVN